MYAIICLATFSCVRPVTVELQMVILNVAVGRVVHRVRASNRRWNGGGIREAQTLCSGFTLRRCCYEVAVEGVGSVNEDVT